MLQGGYGLISGVDVGSKTNPPCFKNGNQLIINENHTTSYREDPIN
jgi:hypothetical protein